MTDKKIIVKVDKRGSFRIPASLRELFKVENFEVTLENQQLILKQIK